MARIRTIKPEFWTDEKVVSISPLARLVFIGLWNFVDDHGRVPFSPLRLKMQILPADSTEFPDIIAEIRGAGLINIYAVDGKEFLQVVGFDKHQRIDKRSASKYPLPTIPTEFPDKSAEIPLEGKGREGKRNADLAPNGAHVVPIAQTPEKIFFDQAVQYLGSDARSLAAKLLKAKGQNVQAAHAALLVAVQKSDPREYLGAIIRGRGGGVEDLRARGEAW